MSDFRLAANAPEGIENFKHKFQACIYTEHEVIFAYLNLVFIFADESDSSKNKYDTLKSELK